ncbi:MAG: TIGR03905 family TSCPD domain-containing protein [Coriobacteriales bacterium]
MSKKHVYMTHGTCARAILVETEGDTIKDVVFDGGCDGNHQGITRLVRGKKISEVADLLEGTPCGMRGTSCPDQLSRALREIEAEEA